MHSRGVVRYLGVAHAVLIALQIDRVQDDLGGLLRLARLWDGIGAQNFVSASRPAARFGILRIWRRARVLDCVFKGGEVAKNRQKRSTRTG